MAEGIDLYGKYNTVTDWNALARAKQFAFIKLSDGLTTRDDYGYVAAGRRAGMSVGGYHYAEFGNPAQQADILVDRCVALGAIDLTPALDLEDPFTPNQTAIDFAIGFCQRVRERGFRPALYANNSMMNTVAAPVKAAVPDVLIWLARYGASPTVAYDVWQYTDKGICTGVNGSVDLNTGIMPYNALPQPPAPKSTVKNTEDSMQTYSYPGCDKDATGALIEREHTFVVPTGAASSLVDYTWVSFKCCNVPATSVKMMTMASGQLNPYVETKTFAPVANDSARVGVEFGGLSSKVDQVTVFAKSAGPYSIVLEHRAK